MNESPSCQLLFVSLEDWGGYQPSLEKPLTCFPAALLINQVTLKKGLWLNYSHVKAVSTEAVVATVMADFLLSFLFFFKLTIAISDMAGTPTQAATGRPPQLLP